MRLRLLSSIAFFAAFVLAAFALFPASPPVAFAADKDEVNAVVAGDDKLVQDVKKSIDDGVTFLLSRQGRDGGWQDDVKAGGGSALVLLGLLNAGVKPTDKAVQRGLTWLRDNPCNNVYGVSLETMVLCLVNDKADKARIEKNVTFLLDARLSDGWTYNKTHRGATGGDNSNSQYALLAIHEAIQRGVKVDAKVLAEVRDFYLKTQNRNGGWGYKGNAPQPTVNMTIAGLCNLLISGMDLAEGKAVLRQDGSCEKCGEYKENDAAKRALEWIGARHPSRFSDEEISATFGSPYYGLYGVERAGRLTGQRYFGGHDWYEIGARWLVKAQKADGHWNSDFARGAHDNLKVVATSFALLFLSKGRTPVLVSKLAYGGSDYLGWNNKRSDVKHLVEYVSRELFEGKPLAWQAFDVRGIDANTEAAQRKLAAELLQTPIVFLNGHDFAPRDKEEAVLREFVSNGGFIFAENCCGKERHPKFDADFQRLIKRILPDAELKKLEPEHPVWTASGKFASLPRDFPLMGVKQGCKTVVIYSPVPLAGYWEANAFADKARGQQTFELAANVVAYATGLEVPRPRLSRVEIAVDSPKEKPKRGYLQVAQLKHAGDWQPAPKAMRNLMVEGRKAGLDVILKTQPVSPTDSAVLDYRFLYLHGRNAFEEKKGDLKDVRFLLKNGGLLFADACCGSKAFDTAFRKFVVELFGDDKLKLEPIPTTDALFGKEINGRAIERVRRRVPVGDKGVSKEYKSLPPALEGVKYKGRWVVIYSKTDVGCALEKHASSECLSHDYDDALRLAKAALLYSLKR